MDDERMFDTTPGKEKPDGYSQRVLITVAMVSAAGLYCLCRAFCHPGPAEGTGIEWRILAMVALAFVLGPLNAEVHGPRGRPARFSLAHAPLFASALALGPADAALPAVFCGISRLLASGRHQALGKTLYNLLKPAAVCATASTAYLAAGGSHTQPQSVHSVGAVAAAAVVYAVTAAALVGLVEGQVSSDPPPHVSAAAIPGWLACLAAGYGGAALYAIAPTYVLLAAAAAVGVLRYAAERPARAGTRTVAQPATEPATECETISFIDPATGLASRRYAEMFLAREISRADRMEHPVSVAVFDLDGPKAPDDSVDQSGLEHLFTQIGRKLRSGLREYDVVGRYSTSRLVVLLPESSAEQTLEVVERLHSSLGPLRVGRQPATMSVGVAAYPEDASSPEDLVNAAHRALNRGRFSGPGAVHRCEELDQAS